MEALSVVPLSDDRPMHVYQSRVLRKGCRPESGYHIIYPRNGGLVLHMDSYGLDHCPADMCERLSLFYGGPKLKPLAGGDYSHQHFDFTDYVKPGLFIPNLFARPLIVARDTGRNAFKCFLDAQFWVNGKRMDWGTIGDYVPNVILQ